MDEIRVKMKYIMVKIKYIITSLFKRETIRGDSI